MGKTVKRRTPRKGPATKTAPKRVVGKDSRFKKKTAVRRPKRGVAALKARKAPVRRKVSRSPSRPARHR